MILNIVTGQFRSTFSSVFILLLVLSLSPAFAAHPLGPATWGSPDQPYGARRPVTASDRALIQSYRSGAKKPVYSTNFTDRAELEANWVLMSDDNYQLCRRPENVEVSSAGLRLKILPATNCRRNLKWTTGSIQGKAGYQYGFFEARMKIADIKGMNNAFWMNTGNQPATGDYFEVDICECQYPNYDHISLQQYPAKTAQGVALSNVKHTGIGWGVKFADDLSKDFHDYGVLWTPKEMIYEVDGEPLAAVVTNNSANAPASVMFSSAAIYAGIPDHPEGHDMFVRSLRIFALQ
jgi:hypothetical protein